jgi:hypothetical protein
VKVAAFAELDWRRIDVTSIVTFGGVNAIAVGQHQACRAWLTSEGYQISTFDCRTELAQAIPELDRLFGWEQQFGYALSDQNANLNAVRDGFVFAPPESGRRVFEILGADLAWGEDREWFAGLLSIAQEYSRKELALGRRFFALLVVPDEGSPVVGAVIEQTTVPLWFGHCPQTADAHERSAARQR